MITKEMRAIRRASFAGVEVDSWIPDPKAVGLTTEQACDAAMRAAEIQAAAHATAEDVEECSHGGCWLEHLEEALTELDLTADTREPG